MDLVAARSAYSAAQDLKLPPLDDRIGQTGVPVNAKFM